MAAGAAKNDETAEGPWQLPVGWCWTPLETVASLRKEKVSPQADPTLPFVGMDDIEPGGTSIVQTRSFGLMKSAGNRFYPGDVLYGRLRPYLNKTAVTTSNGASSGELLAIRPSMVESRYLQFFMHARRFVNTAMSTVSGDRPRIDFATIAQFDFPLAPLAEQRRIVARVDEMFAEIAEGEAALAEARKGLEAFRRALLKAAVTGELTKDWRQEQTRSNPPAETGHDLLARIARVRQTKATRNTRGHRGADIQPVDTSTLGALPKEWAWTKLGDLLSHLTSGSRDWADYYDRGSKIFVMAQNVRPGRYNHSYVKYVDPPDHLKDVERSRVRRDDLLVTIVGANTGDVCRIDFEAKDYFVCQSVALMRPILPEIAPYLEMYLAAPGGGRSQMDKVIYGAGRPHLSFDQIENFAFPIPPPAEGAEILRRVSDALTAAADTLAMLDAEAADAARLKQAILKAAFEGRLVTQDPADEPASVLLARIKAQNSNRSAAKSSQPVRRGSTEKKKR
jgi:type I restriction enzyme S subunit